MAPSSTAGATSPSQRSAPTKIEVSSGPATLLERPLLKSLSVRGITGVPGWVLNRVQFGTVGFPSWPRIPLFPYGDLRQNKAFSDQCSELTISAGARRLRIGAIWP